MTKKDRYERAREATQRHERTAQDEDAGKARGVALVVPGAASHRATQRGTRAMLEELLLRDDGWLRWTRKRDTDTTYCKWKFTHGPHERHYVMAVGEYWQADYILTILLLKLAKVDAGDLSDLAADTWYGNLQSEGGHG